MHLRIAAFLFVLSFAIHSAEFQVTKAAITDPGEGLTLPEAVTLANNSLDENVRISFNIPGAGAHKIEVNQTLVIARSMLIDGTSQPGYAGTPLIQISRGANPMPPTLAISAPVPMAFTTSVFEVNDFVLTSGVSARAVDGFNVIFSALSLTDASDYAIYFSSGSGHVVESCYIGIAPNGALAGNDTGIFISSQVDGIRIGTDGNGDDDAAEGNVFGDNFTGINIGSSSSNVRIAANRIGILPNGTAAKNFSNGIEGNFASSIQILNNIVANNGSNGIYLSTCSDVVIQGNRIVGNGFELKVRGNDRAGVTLCDVSTTLVGTNGDGINDVAERNIISGNGLRGVYAIGQFQPRIILEEVNDPTQVRIAGNYIGVDADGSALPNGTFEFVFDAVVAARDIEDAPGAGVEVTGNIYVIVGSDKDGSAGEAAEGNVISGNKGSGIVAQPNEQLQGSPQVAGAEVAQAILLEPYYVRIAANTIGRAPDKTTARPNTLDGVIVFDAVVEVGGTETGAGNLIANNGRNGVTVLGGESALVTILGNSITGNTALGIDLGNDGVTPNDPNQIIPGVEGQPDRVVGDPDFGPNYFSNFPVLTSISADRKTVTGTLNAEIINISEPLAAAEGDPVTPSSTYRIEFFSNPESSPNQGQRFLGSTDVTISDQTTFTASFTATLTTPAVPGSTVTATATRLDERYPETSEFSVPDANSRVPGLFFSSDPIFTPSNPTTDDIVTFMAQASIPGITVTFDFGDGSSATGETVTHQYAAPGVYSVIVTLLDAPTGIFITKVLQVPVVAGAKPEPKPTVFDFRVRTLKVTLNDAPGTDVIKLNGLISVPKGFNLAGNTLALDVGGVKQTFTLDAKGKSKVGSDVVRFKMPRGKRNQDGSFTASFSKGTFAETLKAAGLNKDANGLPGTIAVRATFNGKDFLRLVPTKFKTKGVKSSTSFGVF